MNFEQGKLLGGSSGVNNQAFIGPSAADIDLWASLGNRKWTWNELSPYYGKTYKKTSPSTAIAEHLGVGSHEHGTKGHGPLQVSYPAGSLDNPLTKAWNDTFDSYGLKMENDPFSGTSIGAYSTCSTIDEHGQRSFAANAYLGAAKARPNLHIMTGVHVQKIDISGEEPKKAERVIYTSDGVEKSIAANREVILAAGVMQSPKILELSGIGDPELLEAHGVDVVVPNKNVGENLQDHLFAGMGFEALPDVATMDPLLRQEPEAIGKAMEEYQTKQIGPLASASMASHAFVPLSKLSEIAGGYDPASFQEHLLADSEATEQTPKLLELLTSPHQSAMSFFPVPVQIPYPPGQLKSSNFISIGALQSHPFSRGRVHILSGDPANDPLIDPCYLSSSVDMDLFTAALHFIYKIAKTPPWSSFLKSNGQIPQFPISQDSESFRAWIKETASTCWHPCGTCAMLPLNKGGVVSEDLLVYGTQNLRIVDASIFPTIPRGNIQSTVYAVAERAADIIKSAM